MKHLINYILIFCVTLNANDYLSKTKKDILEYSFQKSNQDNDKLKKDWINPITYKYIYNKDEKFTTAKSLLTINQPIFKSGGIYFAIKYANSMENLSKSNLAKQKYELIRQVIEVLFQIKKIDFNIQKQQLVIQNSQLDIVRKKELVLNGILDTSFLDNAIIESNTKKNILVDLLYQKTTMINKLSSLSDKRCDQLSLPILKLVTKKDFIDNNLYLKNSKDQIQTSYWLKNMTISQYLPTVNLTANYIKYHDTDDNPILTTNAKKNVGFNITIPLDIRFSNTIQSNKIKYLQNKLNLIDKKTQEIMLYKNANAKIDSINSKMAIAIDDLTLYDTLLQQIIEQKDVGMKTQSDIDTMKNSKKMKEYDIKILKVEKQMEFLNIDARVNKYKQ